MHSSANSCIFGLLQGSFHFSLVIHHFLILIVIDPIRLTIFMFQLRGRSSLFQHLGALNYTRLSTRNVKYYIVYSLLFASCLGQYQTKLSRSRMMTPLLLCCTSYCFAFRDQGATPMLWQVVLVTEVSVT